MSTEKTINTRIKLKRDEESEWDSRNPIILNGEVVLVDGDDGRLRAKIGDGTSTYSALGFIDHIHVITQDNKADPIPENAIVIIDTTEADLTGSITGGGNNGGTGTGADGYSPTVTITTITGGHKVTITDKNGPHNFNVMNGTNGTTPVKGTHYWTAAEKSEIVAEVIAQIPNGNEVAY